MHPTDRHRKAENVHDKYSAKVYKSPKLESYIAAGNCNKYFEAKPPAALQHDTAMFFVVIAGAVASPSFLSYLLDDKTLEEEVRLPP